MNEEDIIKVDKNKKSDEIEQLFAILTSRWIDENGKIRFGATEERLLSAFNGNKHFLKTKLAELEKYIEQLGLSLVKYYLGKEKWYCIRTIYGVPTELTNDEYAVLGVIMYFIEKGKKRMELVNKKKLITKLVTGNYFSKYQLDSILRHLEKLGYIILERATIKYGPRLKIEFDEERRKAIAERAEIILP